MTDTALAVRQPVAKPRRLRKPIQPTAIALGHRQEPTGSLDLELAPSRDEQLAYLNEALGDEREYARRFIVCAYQIGASLIVDRRGRLTVGMREIAAAASICVAFTMRPPIRMRW